MDYRISAFAICECGQRRDAEGKPHQEDSLFPAYGQLTERDRLFVVCDGMGGHDLGEVASATVCEAMSNAIIKETSDTVFTDDILGRAVERAFDALDARDTGSARKMGTTMTLLKLHKGGATIAHIGDSRVYHIRPGKDADSTRILHVTKDHSLLNNLLDIGELTEEDIPNFRQKNVITRAMQPNMEQRCMADIYHTTDIQPDDYFYLCTDGMLENTTDEHIRFIFSKEIPDKEKRKTLIRVTNKNKDNHSAIVVHILDVGGEVLADRKGCKNLGMVSGSEKEEQMTVPSPAIGNDGNGQKSVDVQDTTIPGIVIKVLVISAVVFILSLFYLWWH